MKLPKISDKNLYFNTVKRNLPMMLLFFVGMFIVFDVTLFMTLQSANRWIANSGDFRITNIQDPRLYYAEMTAVNYGAVSEVISVICAVFAGCVATKYLMNKRSAALFGSIPQSRTNQFISSYFACATSYIIPLVVTSLIEFGIFTMEGFSAGIGFAMPYILTGIMWFFFFYTFTAAVGMLCGMTSIQLLGTGTLLAYIPVAFLLLIGYGEEFYVNIEFEHYIDVDIFNVLTPVCRFATSFENRLAWYEVAAYIVATAVIFIVAVLLYKLRDNSKAGSPIVFDRVVPVIKYALMVIFTLFCGLALFSINYHSGAWLFVGCAIGVVVSYMILNAILYKNARAVFTNPKGLLIFSIVFAVLLTTFSLDPLGIDNDFPTVDTARSVQASLSGGSITFSEPENIETAYKIINNALADDPSVDYYDSSYYPDPYVNNLTHVFSQYASFGVTSKYGFMYSRGFRLPDVTKYREEYLSLYNSDEFLSVLKKQAKKSARISVTTVVKNTDGIYEDRYLGLYEGWDSILSTYLDECDGMVIHDDKGPAVAEVDIGPCRLPVYFEYTETLKKLEKHSDYDLYGMIPTSDNIDEYLSDIDSITVGHGDDAIEYTSREEIRDVFMNSVGFADCAPAFMGDSSKLAVFKNKTAENSYDYAVDGYYETSNVYDAANIFLIVK